MNKIEASQLPLQNTTVVPAFVELANYSMPTKALHPAFQPRRHEQNTFLLYYTPLLVATGSLANSLCASLFIGTSILRKFSSSHYLFSIALLNNTYLLVLLMAWLTNLGYNVYDRQVLCHVVDLLSNLSSFLSVWLAVTFCVDRYIAICWPQESSKMCTPIRAKIVIMCLVIVALTIYLNISLTVGVSEKDGKCKPVKPFHFSYVNTLRVIDLVVNHILPYIVVIILLSLIGRSIYWQQRELTLSQTDDIQIRATTVLYFVVFLMAQVPADCLRITSFVNRAQGINSSLITWQLITNYISHTAMALNLLILVLTHPLFRQSFQGIFNVKRMFLGDSSSDNQLAECIELKLFHNSNDDHETVTTL